MNHREFPGCALITGASSGIGAAIARAYAARGMPLILTARREDRLHALAAELSSRVAVHVIAADLADPHAAEYLVRQIGSRGLTVRILVNNAGYGVPGRYDASDWAVHAASLQVMLTAVCELTWRLLPQLRASGHGRIINVSSVAALMPAADGQTLYAPVKSFLLKFSESLSLENAAHGVLVCALCPGFTRSEFHDITGSRELMRRMPRWIWLPAERVARAGIEGVERGRVIVVPGWHFKLLCLVARLLPQPWLLSAIGRDSRKFRRVD